ncbi:MAG TPA: cyclic peptide export ABC transporter [Thermoanaerobaculia bacterium]|nr:cyclic peptide export ABC transporter [Thermoanaerobaculia bacterium]
MKLLTFLLRRSRTLLILAVLAGLASGACGTGLLAVINAALAGTLPRATLLWSFVGLCLLVPLTRISSEVLLNQVGQDTVLDLRMRLSGALLKVPLRHLEQLGRARVLTALTDDVPTITNAVSSIPVLCINLATALGGFAYLGWLSWKVLGLVLIFLVVGIATYQVPMLRAVRYMYQTRKINDELYRHFSTLTDGAKELKLHRDRRDAFLREEMEAAARRFRDANVRGLQIFSVAASWGQVLLFVVLGLLLFAFHGLDARVLTGYSLTLLYLVTPLQTLLNSAPTFSRARVALGHVEALGVELEASAGRETPAPRETAPGWERIALAGVTHAYRRDGEDGEFLLGPIDLELRPRELVFIAGGNGSGKTTLAKLLAGLYAPDAGVLLWNGRPVTDENRDAYRQSFSAVFSDFYLFQSLLGLDVPDLDVKAAGYLDLLQLRHKVQVQEGRLSTLELSQGQRKRLALLTAYLEDRPIYLFDEWAADQDPVFREVFYRQLLPELKKRGKTAVVISHDDRYYDVADRLIKLENGQVVSTTTPVLGEMAPESLSV